MKMIWMLLCLALLVSSCAHENKVRPSRIIGVSLLTRAHVFYKDLEEGLQMKAAQYGYQLSVTAADFDLGKQTAQVEDFITQKVDAIIVCPADSRGIGAAIRKANEAKIPVFTADIAAQEGEVICHIASDNVAGGRIAGEYLVKLLERKGSVAILGQPTVTSVLDRVQGFKDALSRFPSIKIVADVNGEGVRDKAMQAAADILQAHPDLDAIFGINDDSALGALDAVQQFNRKSVTIVGYDATPPAVDAIIKNTPLKADVIQHPTRIGAETVEQIKKYFDGLSVPKIVPVDVGIVDREILLKSAAQQ